MTTRCRDRAVLLGRRKSLVGIITPGEEVPGATKRPMAVILNAGILHRVGPNRLHVILARAMAATGSAVLRFDLSGIGDSAPQSDDSSPLESALSDIKEALDWLEANLDQHRFILLGLCSGADHAILAAASDSRVAGLILLDPVLPATPQYFINRTKRKLRKLAQSPYAVVAGRVQHWLSPNENDAMQLDLVAEGGGIEDPELMALFRTAYRKSMEAGIATLAILTDGLEEQHNYREQLVDAFPDAPFEGRLRVEYYTECDHTFSLEANRARLIREVVGWIQELSCQGSC